MVADAEKYAAEDEQIKERTAAKNGLESYAYSLKQTLESPETGDKLSDADKGPVKEKLDEVLKFLEESSESASIEEIKERQTELEGLANPMMQKLYAQGGAPGGMPGGAPGAGAGDASGPEVEEGESIRSRSNTESDS
jgi:heat shock protein 1/8